MRFLLIISRQYPWQTAAMLLALVLSGIFEGIGLSAMLPLLAIALKNYQTITADSSKEMTAAEQMVQGIFETIGLTPSIEILLLFILATMLLKCAFVLIANKRVGYTVAHLTTKLRHQTLKAFISARWEFHLSESIGKLSVAMSAETSQTARAYRSGVTMIVEVINTVIYIGVALMVSWQATLIALAAGTFFWYPLNRFVKISKRAGRRQVKLRKSLTAEFVDFIQSIKPLKAMARENIAETILIAKTNKLKNALKKEIVSKFSLSAYQEGLKVTFMVIAIYVAIVISGMAPTTVMVLALLLGRIMRRLSKVQQEYQNMGLYIAGYWSMSETLERAREMSEQIRGNKKPDLKQAVRLEEVTFAYSNNKVLDDASLVFRAGEITAIIGPSGSGKTTIVDLVIGLLRPQKGDVWIDDIPLAQIDLQKWRRVIGYVPQEALLLHDSIFSNVTLGDPLISEHQVEEALRKAGIWEFIETTPEGFYSPVGERGLKLSGGQRQRIAIARAIVHQPKLLILDEATTALDPKTEAAVCETLQTLRNELTILAISHQPAILNVADRAYHLEDGKAMLVSDRMLHSEDKKDVNAAFA